MIVEQPGSRHQSLWVTWVHDMILEIIIGEFLKKDRKTEE